MADESQELVVKIDPETPPAGGDGTQKTGDAVVDDLKQQFTALQSRAEAHQSRADQAEQRAVRAEQAVNQLRQEVTTAKTATVDSDLRTVSSGIEAAKTALDAAEIEFKSAMEAGDFDKAAKAQKSIALAGARLVRLEEAEDDVKARKEAVTKDPPVPTQHQQQVDPVDAYIAGRTAPTAAWLRDHKDWITDPRKNAKLTAAHYNATAEGIAVDTKEYFDHVENYLGLKQQQQDKAAIIKDPPPAPSQTERRAPVAPVNGNASSGGTNGGSAEVRLSAQEAKAATDGTLVWNYDDQSGQKRFKKGDPIGVQEFARRKLEMQRSGQYDRVYINQ